MDDASPAKWHLAHTTWFFEAFLLKPFLHGYRVFDERFEYCFNSYYESVGPRHPRPKRGLLTRPSAEDVRDYRAYDRCGARSSVRRPARARGGRADRARHQSRAAASGTAADRYLAACSPPNRSSPPIARPAPVLPWARSRRLTGFRSMAASSTSAMTAKASPTTTRARVTTHCSGPSSWRVAASPMPSGWSSSPMAATPRRRSGSPTAGISCAATIGARRSTSKTPKAVLCKMSLNGFRPIDPAAPVTPCQLLRGRCLRSLGGLSAADRVRVGGCGGKRAARRRHARVREFAADACRNRRRTSADVRRCVGMDGERLSALPRLQGRRRRRRRVQRQVHVQSVRAARRLMRHARAATSAGPIAISSIRTSAGSSPACAWRRMRDRKHDGERRLA